MYPLAFNRGFNAQQALQAVVREDARMYAGDAPNTQMAARFLQQRPDLAAPYLNHLHQNFLGLYAADFADNGLIDTSLGATGSTTMSSTEVHMSNMGMAIKDLLDDGKLNASFHMQRAVDMLRFYGAPI